MKFTDILYDNARHIVCEPYSVSNLHEMARALGLKRGWYHANPYPHYDMPKRWTMDKQLEFMDRLLELEQDHGIEFSEWTTRQLVRFMRGNQTW